MAGFGKFHVEKSVCPMSVRIEKFNTRDSLLKKRFVCIAFAEISIFKNGLVNSRCDHSASPPLPPLT